MKKLLGVVITMAVVFILFFATYIRDIESWYSELKYYNITSEAASKQLENMQYGKNAMVDKIIALKAEAESWNFRGQEGFSLIRTGDLRAPFVASVQFRFTDPDDKNRLHILRDTYIFNFDYDTWVPLISDLVEFSKGKLRPIVRYEMWQGDYDIPFFKP